MRIGKKVKHVTAPERKSQKVGGKPVEVPKWKKIPVVAPQPQPVMPSGV